METIFATAAPRPIDRIKGFIFRMWYKPYTNIRRALKGYVLSFTIPERKKL